MNPDVKVALAEVGYVEQGGADHRSGNITKYWAAFPPHQQGAPWCARFVRWVNRKAGTPDLPIANPDYCPSIVTYAKQHGLWTTDQSNMHESDWVLFDFEGHGVADHIGRVVVNGGRAVTTVEGNTSPGNTGSQRNGGGVYERNRLHGSTILGIVKYSKLVHRDTPVPAPRNPPKHNPNPAGSVKWIQWAVGVPVDGVKGPQTVYAIKQFQKYHHLVPDGVVGPKTSAELAKVTH